MEGARDTGEAVLYRYNRSGEIVDTAAHLSPPAWTRIELPGEVSFVKPRMAPDPRVAAIEGKLALAAGARYEIQIRRPDGSLARRVTRVYENLAVTPETRDSVLALLSRTRENMTQEALEQVPFAAVIPAIESLTLDRDGRLWVDPYDPDVRRRDVFDREGRFLGPVYLPHPVFLEDVRGNRACGVISDPSGPSSAFCYRIVREDE